MTIPGFGAFIATTIPALIDEPRRLFMPPVRYISFNSEITHNDGLIAASVARRDGISFETASAIVDKAVEQLRREIATYGSVDFGPVGTIKSDEKGLLQFTPAPCPDFVNPYSVLSPVLFPTADAAEEAPRKRQPRIIRIGTSALRIAASVTITVSLGALLFVPLRDSSAIPIVKAAIWPSEKKTEEIVKTFDERQQPDIQLIFAEAPDRSDETDSITPPTVTEAYGVVVGVFSSADKAETFIAGRQGLSCGNDRRGFTRVYAATTATMEESASIAARFRNSGEWPEAWPAKIQ